MTFATMLVVHFTSRVYLAPSMFVHALIRVMRAGRWLAASQLCCFGCMGGFSECSPSLECHFISGVERASRIFVEYFGDILIL